MRPTREDVAVTAAGLATGKATVAGLTAEAKQYLARRNAEDELREDLTQLDRPVVELPFLPQGVDRDGLATLAGILSE